MPRVDGVDVHEAQHEIVFVQLGAGDLASGDLAENALIHGVFSSLKKPFIDGCLVIPYQVSPALPPNTGFSSVVAALRP
jgi:hypothetical protein